MAGSLALLSDAGHMVTDAASLGLALFAQRVAARPPSHRASYGYARAEVIAAFVNALLLLALVVFIAIEAVRRLLAPEPVSGGWVVGIAAVGLVRQSRGDRRALGRRELAQRARRAPARPVRSPGLGGGARRGRRHPRDRMDADRSDPVAASCRP